MGDAALESGRWTLTSHSVEGRASPVPEEVKVDARFEAGRVAGSAGCNSYQAGYTRTGTKLGIGPIAATNRFCEGPAADVESTFLASLERADSFSATAGRLVIFDESGRTLLEFAAAPPNPLVGSWKVTGYNNGAGALVSVTIGTELTASFGEDGQLHGSTGCNEYSGSFVVDGRAPFHRAARDHAQGVRRARPGPGGTLPRGAPGQLGLPARAPRHRARPS